MKGLRVLELSEALDVDSYDLLAVCAILNIKYIIYLEKKLDVQLILKSVYNKSKAINLVNMKYYMKQMI